MTMLDQVLSLVQQALDDFDKPDITVSNLVRRAIRIARLRNDFDNLWWLELEMQAIDPGSKARARTTPEMLAHYEHREFRELTNRELAAYFSRRRWPAFDSKGVPQVNKRSESFFPRSVAEIEAELASISEQIASAVPPPGLHTLDLYYRDQELSKVRQVLSTKAELLRGILEAIRQRVYQFLIDTEHGLVYGQLNADIFERNRRYVDKSLKAIAPDVLEKFAAAYRRLAEGDAEARSQALTSCRRILKSLADRLYPATDVPLVGSDGKEHELTDARYISRLRQYAFEQVGSRSAGKVLLAEVERLGVLLDRLYDLDSKGVHGDVSQVEVEQCAIQTYLVVGDLLRLAERHSAILTE
jgi:hypothetical protein